MGKSSGGFLRKFGTGVIRRANKKERGGKNNDCRKYGVFANATRSQSKKGELKILN
jgi:hypothetical protein